MAEYMRMDINAFMVFFSEEAVENRMLTMIFVRSTEELKIATPSLSWRDFLFRLTKKAHVTGRYEVIQTLKGTYKESFRETFSGIYQ
jgi:hypothetical protein